MHDKVKCPICDETIEYESHPNKPGWQVAYCSCRGTRVAVIETILPTRTSFKEKENKK